MWRNGLIIEALPPHFLIEEAWKKPVGSEIMSERRLLVQSKRSLPNGKSRCGEYRQEERPSQASRSRFIWSNCSLLISPLA